VKALSLAAHAFGICVTVAACGGSPAPTPAPVAAPKPPAPVAAVLPAAQTPALVPQSPAVPGGDGPKYEAKGRKDPFVEVQALSGPSGLSVASTRLTGIVRGPLAVLALLETADGIGYILKPGDTLGDGRLMEIGADNVVFAVSPKPGISATRVVLRLAAN
jgi:hypothetical protein